MEQERALFDSLHRPVRYHADGRKLVIASANGAVIFTFSR